MEIYVKPLIGFMAKFLSRKLIMSLLGVYSCVWSVGAAAKSGLSDQVLMVSLPLGIVAIATICVAYVTGVAKIEIQASANLKKE